ncbi:polyprenyl synthetase family protein [Streptomyces sp. DH24]|uniref:polyprenyl synthetase family protein n=1 Tax=Streptomyces sp. DH24 TaxID=3040123 RepID=UPI002442C943|nr:polyprenyl synthetase family protein [Streptomyces sp. DH24]MDG9718896.1 polyprenyl synthetase family protein [Streptomyces sp. DH24]
MVSPDAVVTTDALVLAGLRARVDALLAGFLRRRPTTVPAQRATGDDLSTALADFVLAPGKRIRPLLCVLGWHAGGGSGAEDRVLRLAASLELFHAFALVHDDIMDASDTRRGRPSAHRAFATRHADRRDADAFGTGAAILLGDLALVRADEMLHTVRLSAREQKTVLPLLDAMRNEVVHGQYLDLLATGAPSGDIERALTVNRLKTAKYTVERPLHLGAALAGADTSVLRACSAYAIPLGEAFQLRDDLLGAFGDPRLTGKSAAEDLRSGKATVLMALAVRRADRTQRAHLVRMVGNPELDESDAARVRLILEQTGARDTVERMIADRYGDALDALERARFAPGVTSVLHHIATAAVRRTA